MKQFRKVRRLPAEFTFAAYPVGFHYMDSTITLFPEYEIASLYPYLVIVKTRFVWNLVGNN